MTSWVPAYMLAGGAAWVFLLVEITGEESSEEKDKAAVVAPDMSDLSGDDNEALNSLYCSDI